MIWVLVIALALAGLAVALLLMRGARGRWPIFGAALSIGLAGYALHASPDLPGAPATGRKPEPEFAFALVDARREMMSDGMRSHSKWMLTADAYARRGQFETAAGMLGNALHENPRDAEATLALANALVEHADGALTKPALLAYRRAARLDPKGLAPGYFLGLALIRQGQLLEARQMWIDTLATAPADAAGREAMAERLGRLDALLLQQIQMSQPAETPAQAQPNP